MFGETGLSPCRFVGLSYRGAGRRLLLLWDFLLRLFPESSICRVESRRMNAAAASDAY